jgi:succinate dehydrogenase/fumarate reductase flavoprotein subunit
MAQALREIQELRHRIKSASASPPTPDTRHPTPIYHAPWNEAINTENLALIAEMLTRSALAREESRGAHYRSDFPKQNVDWLKNVIMRPRDDGDFEMTFRDVEFTRLTPDELTVKRERAGLKTLPALDDE